MGFFDKLVDAAKNYDYEGAIQKKYTSIENRARSEFRQKARNASDYELEHNLRNAIDIGNYVMEEEIKREMDRRGLHY